MSKRHPGQTSQRLCRAQSAASRRSAPTTCVLIYYAEALLQATSVKNAWDGNRHVWSLTSPLVLAANAVSAAYIPAPSGGTPCIPGMPGASGSVNSGGAPVPAVVTDGSHSEPAIWEPAVHAYVARMVAPYSPGTVTVTARANGKTPLTLRATGIRWMN
ncbi:hypothetical protein JZ785_06980 [Alicyclobacillus curvatus]|jgi:hypothetical protein|nr:hypothetical protein JZ785_06980 [Alicyclobacillus curvatus]